VADGRLPVPAAHRDAPGSALPEPRTTALRTAQRHHSNEQNSHQQDSSNSVR